MAPKLGAKPRASAQPASPEGIPQLAATGGERANVILRIRPALSQQEAEDTEALQCDRASKLVWALGEHEEGGP
eukprot:CAMPEP_0174742760 /NCGR_PEP_ID=MMETSP1094-20130205/79841_1 /TAXON_ID=156173 /ORGANISM="Chrysochromulina brevifilum, Strain UTEX LB 985" /LENGTH=73 /DNA_ID=CAMNT_0015946861 /DNA_START=23 /DNA_END=241 /DNA_ORIENTATION=+